MHLVHVASEATPFAKTGGLGDVVGALPQALAELGHHVTLILPDYPASRANGAPRRDLATFVVQVAGKERTITTTAVDLAPRYRAILIRQSDLFDRNGVYGDPIAGDYPDNAERFAFLNIAAIETLRRLREPVDCFHLHDWPTSLLPILLREAAPMTDSLTRAGTVLTIHNLAFQGIFSLEQWPAVGLSDRLLSPYAMGCKEGFSFLRGGLRYADELTAVSRQYAMEIQSKEHGCDVEDLLAGRAHRLTGIVNGIDEVSFNPSSDSAIAQRFDVHRWREGKAANRRHLRKLFGLPDRPDWPVMGMVGRLTEQKGFDLLAQVGDRLGSQPAQLCVLGLGDPKYQSFLEKLAAARPDRVAARFEFDDALARQIYAGSDMFLMPSRFEPCGLSQLYSLRYGSVPVVHAVGGLIDTVVDATPERMACGEATGIVFTGYRADRLAAALDRALALFRKQDDWERMIQTGMTQDWSWKRSAGEYVSVYERATRTVREMLGP